MLGDEDRKILDQLVQRIRSHFPEARIWAFGSRARGDASEYSDFDVCIVLPAFPREDDALLLHIAWEVGFDNGRVFNLIPISAEQFDSGPMSESTLKKNILAEGIPA